MNFVQKSYRSLRTGCSFRHAQNQFIRATFFFFILYLFVRFECAHNDWRQTNIYRRLISWTHSREVESREGKLAEKHFSASQYGERESIITKIIYWYVRVANKKLSKNFTTIVSMVLKRHTTYSNDFIFQANSNNTKIKYNFYKFILYVCFCQNRMKNCYQNWIYVWLTITK